MKKNRINFNIEDSFIDNIKLIPQPKFKINQKVYYVDYWDGKIEEQTVASVEWDVKFCNNGYVNFIEFTIRYSFEGDSLHYSECENRMFDNLEQAEEFSLKVKEKKEKYLQKQKEEQIKELTIKLGKLLNE